MGLIKGLDNITARVEADEARNQSGDYVQAKWFKLLDKHAATVVPLQELDEGNPGYSEKNGLGVLAVEHVHPKNYRNKAVCSLDDEGRCYGCEMNAKFPRTGWNQKTKLYLNVLFDNGVDDPEVRVLSSGLGKGQVAPSLIEFLKDIEEGDPVPSLTQTKFRIKRSGSGLSDTSYTVLPKGPSKVNVENYELYDIDKVLRQIPYGEQEAHYNRGINQEDAPEDNEELVSAGSSSEAEW